MRRFLIVLALAVAGVSATAGPAQAVPPPSIHKTVVAPHRVHVDGVALPSIRKV